MFTKTGYEITVEPSEEYEDWYVATAINREIEAQTWGSGEDEISAIRDCLFSINTGEIFELEEYDDD